MNDHIPGHQQALVKDNIVIVVLSFSDHDTIVFEETFLKFDYDRVIDLCNEIDVYPELGSAWNGTEFLPKPFDSWILDNSYNWIAPVPAPDEMSFWDEDLKNWTAFVPSKD